MSDEPTLIERLRHASKNASDPYMHELHGRAADRIELLETGFEAVMRLLPEYTSIYEIIEKATDVAKAKGQI